MAAFGRLRIPAASEDPATVEDGLQLVKVDDKVRFDDEPRPYTVRAISADRRWVICTKPFNPKRTVIYCVLDRVEQRRGPDNCYGLGYETPEDIVEALARFDAGAAEVSVRSDVRLNVTELIPYRKVVVVLAATRVHAERYRRQVGLPTHTVVVSSRSARSLDGLRADEVILVEGWEATVQQRDAQYVLSLLQHQQMKHPSMLIRHSAAEA